MTRKHRKNDHTLIPLRNRSQPLGKPYELTYDRDEMQTTHNSSPVPENELAHSIVSFWFSEISPKQWWVKSIEFDQLIRDRFLSVYEQTRDGQHLQLLNSAQSCLARIIVLDQFPRNIFRDKPESFQTDALALAAANHAVSLGFDSGMPSIHKAFLYMPLMHSEALTDQAKAIELFTAAGSELQENLKSSHRHKAIIEQFGRFPHRNQILGRTSTQSEVEFLIQPSSRF
jgi:uncharacterized protein (DUF924 family)